MTAPIRDIPGKTRLPSPPPIPAPPDDGSGEALDALSRSLLPDVLTPLEEKFCRAMAEHGDLRHAAAYALGRQTLSTIPLERQPECVHSWLESPTIQARIRELIRERAIASSITREGIIASLWEMANVDITELLELGAIPEKAKRTRKDAPERYYLKIPKDGLRSLPPHVRRAIKSVHIGPDGSPRIEMYARTELLERVSRLAGIGESARNADGSDPIAQLFQQIQVHVHTNAPAAIARSREGAPVAEVLTSTSALAPDGSPVG